MDRNMVTATLMADTDAATVTLVTAEEAACLVGVSVRTIRRWIQQGHLLAVESENGKLVSPADLTEAKTRASHGHRRGQQHGGHGHSQGHEAMVTDADTAMTAPAISSAASAQLQAIRDEWLQPLVDRIEELSRENGRLEQERDTLRAELAALRVTPVLSAQDAIPGPVWSKGDVEVAEPLPHASDSLALRWRAWWRRMRGE